MVKRAPAKAPRRRTQAAAASPDKCSRTSPQSPPSLSNLEQDTLAKIVDYLKANPENIYEEFCRLTSKPAETKNDAGYWNETYVYWRSISKAWLSNLIVELAGSAGLTAKVLESVDEKNQDSVRYLCLLFFGIRGEETIPRACLHKVTMRKWLKERGEHLWKRYSTFISDGGLNKDNTINHMKVPLYKLTFDGEVAIKVSHKTMGPGNTPSK